MTYNISEPHQREIETKNIEIAKKRIQVLFEIEKSNTLCLSGQFDEAIKHLKETIDSTINIVNLEDELCRMLNINLTRAYSGKIHLIITEGDEACNKGQLEESINIYMKALDIVSLMNDGVQKNQEKETIEKKINGALSRENDLVVKKGKELLKDGKLGEAENELNKSLRIIERMYQSELKQKERDKIAELINPIYLEKIKSYIEATTQIINKENYQESILNVNKAIENLQRALEITQKMAESKEKSNQVKSITNFINETCLKAIKPRKDVGIQLIKQKKFDDAIRELYSAVSLAKNLQFKEEENEELASIKRIINRVYLAEAEDGFDKGAKLVEEDNLDGALQVFNDALKVTNKMYLSEEMDSEVNKIKNAIYQVELKQIVKKGELSEEEKKLEDEINRLNKLIEASSSIMDPDKKAQKLDELRNEIDNIHVERISLLIEQANQLAEQNKYDSAFENFEKCISITEFIHFSKIKEKEIARIIDNYNIELNNKARQEIINEEYQNVLELCNKAIELDESHVESYYNLGNMYRQMNNMEKAIEFYQKTFGLDPFHSNAFNELGLVYAQNGENDKAIDSYKRAIEVDPNHARAWYHLGKVYKIKREHEQALHAFNKAVEIDPDLADAWFLLGKVNFIKKKYNTALEYLEKAIGIKPELGRTITPVIKDFKSIVNLLEEKLNEL